jgi:hypothetical protein
MNSLDSVRFFTRPFTPVRRIDENPFARRGVDPSAVRPPAGENESVHPPRSITLSCRSRSNGAVTIGCHSSIGALLGIVEFKEYTTDISLLCVGSKSGHTLVASETRIALQDQIRIVSYRRHR